jgi:predicted NBD/HSP70 family sugar kinase
MRKFDLSNFQIANSGTARDINRRIVLNLIRQHQPVSRADLSRHTGLQRSTISGIASELVADRWVREGAVNDLPRGRKPTLLHLNENRAAILGIDIRPFSTSYALANLAGHFLEQETLATAANPAQFAEQAHEQVRKLMRQHPQIAFESIGVSLPGRIETATQKFVFAPNLHWPEVNLKSLLETTTGLPVELENAANACALAELWFGRHAANMRDLIVVTVSEGIGVGIVLNGQLVRGTSGLAGEFGHVTLSPEGPKCGCGNYGCWEMFASNTAALRYYAEAKSASGQQKNSEGVTFEDLLRLAKQEDAAALGALDRTAGYLGRGITMLVTGLSPELIVVVGEITRVWDRMGSVVAEVVQQHSHTHAKTKIQASVLGAQPRLRGIVALMLQRKFGAPNFD